MVLTILQLAPYIIGSGPIGSLPLPWVYVKPVTAMHTFAYVTYVATRVTTAHPLVPGNTTFYVGGHLMQNVPHKHHIDRTVGITPGYWVLG